MCGGRGTRLRPLTFDRPKPAIPILNRPSVARLVDHLSNNGFTDIVITLGYMGKHIEEVLGDGSLYGVSIHYVYEDEPLGTAGSVKNAQKLLDGEPFLVVGGDHVTDVDLRRFYRFHLHHDSPVSIGLICIDDPSGFGIADVDVNGNILRFKEKPSVGEIFSNLASTGMYVCDPMIFDYIPEGKYDFAYNLFPSLMERGYIIKGYLMSGHWSDVGSPEAYREASKWMLENLTETRITGTLNTKSSKLWGKLSIGGNISIGMNSSLVGPIVIGENTTIGDNVLIGPYTSIGSGCVIRDNSKILSSYLYDRVCIGCGTTVSGSIVDSDTTIGNDCTLESGCVIGPRTVIKNGVVVHSGVRIWPEVVVPDGTVVKENLFNQEYECEIDGS